MAGVIAPVVEGWRGAASPLVAVLFMRRRLGVALAGTLLLVGAVACGGSGSATAAAGPPAAGQPGQAGQAGARVNAAAATQTRAAQGQVARTPTPPSGLGPAAATQTRAAQLQAVGQPTTGPAAAVRTPTPTLSAQVRECYFVDGQPAGVALKDACIGAQARAQAVCDCQEARSPDMCAQQWAKLIQASQDHQLRVAALLCINATGSVGIGGSPSASTQPGDRCSVGQVEGRTVSVVRN
jgi:hypothetical protein